MMQQDATNKKGDAVQAYDEFLQSKLIVDTPTGKHIERDTISPVLFDWQQALVQWAIQHGRAGLFASTGLGKGLMALEFARLTGQRSLIVAPLAVAQQFVKEAERRLWLEVRYVRTQEAIRSGINVTNYERLHHFIGADIDSLVADESAIIKHVGSKTQKLLLENFQHVPYRLSTTATPAPNDSAEMAQQSAFLGVLKRTDMLATFFVHDDAGWRLRGHAQDAFYRWLASWSMALLSPTDLGYDGSAFQLPPLIIKEHFLKTTWQREGELFPGMGLKGITDRMGVRKQTTEARAEYAAQLASDAKEQVVIWCGLNEESTLITHLLKNYGALEVKGSDTPEMKEERLLAFADGHLPILVTKAKIAGWGLNFQSAHHAIFLGLNDSHELYYQAVRRLWRYGQRSPVYTHVVLSEHERAIWENVQHKERESLQMIHGLIDAVKTYEQHALHHIAAKVSTVDIRHAHTDSYDVYHGDSCETIQDCQPNSVHFTMYSPPFLALYQYNASARDMGNCTSANEFFTHHGYLADALLRAMVPGRILAMHVSDVPAMQVRDDWIGLKNFSGHMVDHMVARGWLYHGKYVCDKDPQAQAIRIRAKGLAFQQLHKDAAWMRPALPDYILLFRKPGDNPIPIVPDIDNETWIEWAHPVWYSTSRDKNGGFRETYTLNTAEAKEHDDDRHICPLAIDLVERCVRLYSNPNEVCCDPFAGIGTVGFVALQQGRRFLGSELKASYYETMLKNLERAQHTKTQLSLI